MYINIIVNIARYIRAVSPRVTEAIVRMRPVLNASCQIDMCTPRIHEQLVKKSEITFTIQVRRMVAAGRICN